MKRQAFTYFLAFSALLLTLPTQAHDPKEHMKEAQAPDCAPMKEMDHSKMDMQDPVMQAMMQKCMKTMHHDENGANHEQTGHKKNNKKTDPKMPAHHKH